MHLDICRPPTPADACCYSTDWHYFTTIQCKDTDFSVYIFKLFANSTHPWTIMQLRLPLPKWGYKKSKPEATIPDIFSESGNCFGPVLSPTNTNGTISSPGYAEDGSGQYGNGLDLYWLIQPSSVSPISIVLLNNMNISFELPDN